MTGYGDNSRFQVDLKALRDDADTWHRVGAAAAQAQHSVDALTLGEHELSWAGARTGLLGTYEQLRSKASRLLGQAQSTHEDLSRTLSAVANAYERSSTEAASQFAGVWDPAGVVATPAKQGGK
ncbi:MAG: hypothetical protein J2P15_23370 [Micromonosporaceae bacterium]|nr:hypothetical protein [Micromonosporaceae bacterium]